MMRTTRVIAITAQVLADRPHDVVARAANIFASAAQKAAEGDTTVVRELPGELEQLVAQAPAETDPRVLLVRAYHGLQQFDKAALMVG